MDQLTPCLIAMLEAFRPCFRKEVFQVFQRTVGAWCACLGKRSISRVWETTGKAESQSHCAAFRMFSQAIWNWDEICRILLLKLLGVLVPGLHVWIAVDDTLCHKRGAKVAFGGIFLDAVLSSKKHKNFRYGNNWVTMTLIVRLPFRKDRDYALPILWRVYEKKTDDNQLIHRTKLEIAAEMIQVIAGWIPLHSITLVADSAYLGKDLLRDLPSNVEAIGPLRWDAALHARPDEQAHRNRKKGDRLPTPKTMLADDKAYPAETLSIEFLGQTKTLEVKRITNVLWYDVRHVTPVQVVLVRDPSGRWRDEALVCTDPSRSVVEIITGYCRRWSIELSYYDSKQYLGFHDPQVHCEKSVERAAPMAWFLSSLLVLWYSQHGADCEPAHRHRPWYRTKKWPTFADMLATLRLSLWSHWLFGDREKSDGLVENTEQDEKLAWLLEYLSTAA